MTRIQRRLLIDTSIIGVGLTLFIAALDYYSRALTTLDEWFYDRRAHLCQYFTPPPTDKLVHVDIDDRSLATLGKWPWPGTTLAHLIDEIDRAGPKAIAMDIIFSEPDEIRVQPIDPSETPEDRYQRDLQRFLALFPKNVRGRAGQLQIDLPAFFKTFWQDPGPRTVRIDHDANFAAAIARSGKTLVPVSLTLPTNPPPLQRKIREHLICDLEQAEANIYERLIADPDKVLPQGAPFPTDAFLMARREAMNSRISKELEGADLTLEQLRARLLPRLEPDFGGAPLLRLLTEEHRRVQAVGPLRRFVLPSTPGLPPLATFTGEIAPVPAFSRAAAFSGYVEYVQTNERGVVRSIPLVADYRQQLFPQMDLVLACAVLGVDVKTVKLHPDKVIIPKPPGRDRDIVIPVRSMYATKYGRDVGLMMDVPDRGRRAWETIYDHRRHTSPQGHIPMAFIWEVYQFRTGIDRNNANIDRALRVILEQDPPADSPLRPRLGLDPDQYKQYAAKPLAPDEYPQRKERAQATLKLMKEFGYDKPLADQDLPKLPGTNKPDPREMVKRDEVAAARRTLESAIEQNDRFLRIMAQRRSELRDKIAGRAVLIGWTGTGQVDFFPTAIQPECPGVVIHGMAYNAIMTGEFWRHAPKWVTFLITVLVGFAVTAANGFFKPSAALGLAVLIAVVYLLVNGLLLFDYANICLGVAGPMVALASVWSTGALAGFLIEAAERTRITRRFSSWVDKKLVDYVIENPDVNFEGQVREMSVVFTDLAGFTSMAESLRERTIPILSDYLSMMVPVIRRHDGLLNKFLGDGIMFFFNAPRDDPQHAANAVAACLDMQKATAEFAEQQVKKGLPRLSMRCGVSTGGMVVGDSGPVEYRDYTVLGDNVNFASRLESANKIFGTSILISQRTVELLGDRFLVRPVGKLQVVGKTEGVMTWEPLAPLDHATDQQRLLCSMSAEMVAAYVSRDFQTCIKVARRMDDQFGPTKLAEVYRHTAKQYFDNPPSAGFTGNLILTEK
jgi:class 3 adenylate cyclase